MGTFLRHEPCPKCGSKDNLARYEDNSAYCFGCGYVENPNKYTPSVEKGPERQVKLPLDTTNQLGSEALEWLAKYDINQSERIKYRFLWSPEKKQLIFPLFDKSQELLAYQARNFSESSKSKYFTQGKIHEMLYFCGKQAPALILVEDLISAIKIARIGWAMPLFGSEASTPLLMRLKDHCRSVIVWLDSDKWKNSHDIVKRSQSIGLPAMSVFTNLDPKEYSDEKIKYFLTN